MANRYWVGANNNPWSTTASWRSTITGSTGVSFTNGDTVYFCHNNIAGAARDTFMDGARSVAVIYGNSNMGSTSVNGGTSAVPASQTLTLGVGGINLALNNGANNFFVGSNAPIYVPATITINSGVRTIFINSAISGAASQGIDFSGSGAFQNSANHTITGPIKVLSGGLTLSSYLTGSYGNALSLQVYSGAVCALQVSRVHGTGNGYQWVIQGTLQANTGNQILPFYSQLIDGTMTGTSTDTLGAYTVLAGQTPYIDTTTSAVTGGTISAPIGIASTGVLGFYVKTGKTLTVSSVLGTSGASGGALIKAYSSPGSEGGTLLLSGTNIYSGGTTINDGTVKANNLQALGTGAVTVSGATARLQTVSSLNGKLTIGGKLTMASSGILRIGG